ncbi:esterase-like activity of phytase family protein [Kosakonia sp. WA-90]|uniref:esterase-like activity of phytase family protein n=1 Tax=Kosakonia sp. WA-90 TaxID=3153576 RepID=UPI00325DF4C2
MKKVLLTKYIALTVGMSALSVSAIGAELTFLNEYSIPTATSFQNVKFGGLSAMAYDPAKGVYYAITDARNTPAEGMARFYTLNIKTNSKGIQRVDIQNMQQLTDADGKSFKEQEVDGEGFALTPDKKSVLWTSELGSPLRLSSLDGKLKKDFADKIPVSYNAGGDLKKAPEGLRNGATFEGASVTPDGKFLFVAAESALKQDGGISTTVSSSPVRILKFALQPDGNVGELVGEYIYNVDPIPRITKYGVSDNGLSEILALGNDKLLITERAGRNASEGFNDFDFNIRTYISDLSQATNIIGKKSLADVEKKNLLQPVSKKLLIDFDDYTKAPDCIEAVTFGPQINGKKSLIFVSDNNFQPYQATKFFMFVDDKGVLN